MNQTAFQPTSNPSLPNVSHQILCWENIRVEHLQTYEGGLPPRQLRQVLDYIDAHLDQQIKLENLDQLLGMSQFHFSGLFKQSLGSSPYQFNISFSNEWNELNSY